ncbi:MAG: M56 family metallopeptidase [Thermoguttaceae bacterium]
MPIPSPISIANIFQTAEYPDTEHVALEEPAEIISLPENLDEVSNSHDAFLIAETQRYQPAQEQFLPEQNIWDQNVQDQSASEQDLQESIELEQFARDAGISFSQPENVASRTEKSRVDFWPLIIGVWCLGILIMIGVFSWQLFTVYRWLQKSEPLTNETAMRIYLECRRKMQVKTWLVLVESPGLYGPFLIRTIRPTLLLPQGFAQKMSPQELQTVFLHELAHLKRWDTWTSWVMSLLLIVYWFNPLFWLAVRCMNDDKEEASDVLALETLGSGERPYYGQSLLDIVSKCVSPTKTPGLVGITENGQSLTRRISMLKQLGTWKYRYLALAVILLTPLFIATSTTAEDKAKPKTADEIKTEIKRLQEELQKTEQNENPNGIEISSDNGKPDSYEFPALASEYTPSTSDYVDFPIMKYLGFYEGTRGDKKIGFRIDLLAVLEGTEGYDKLTTPIKESIVDGKLYKTSDEELHVMIYEDGVSQFSLPNASTFPIDCYIGTINEVGEKELELNITGKRVNEKLSHDIPEALKSLKVNVIQNDGNIILEIPENEQWGKIRVERVFLKESLFDEEFEKLILRSEIIQESFPGTYICRKNNSVTSVTIDPPKDGDYPIRIGNGQFIYSGRAKVNADINSGKMSAKIQFVSKKRYPRTADEFKVYENFEELHIEPGLQEINAILIVTNNKIVTIVIPKNECWDTMFLEKIKSFKTGIAKGMINFKASKLAQEKGVRIVEVNGKKVPETFVHTRQFIEYIQKQTDKLLFVNQDEKEPSNITFSDFSDNGTFNVTLSTKSEKYVGIGIEKNAQQAETAEGTKIPSASQYEIFLFEKQVDGKPTAIEEKRFTCSFSVDDKNELMLILDNSDDWNGAVLFQGNSTPKNK